MVASAEFDPIIVDAKFTVERFRELLAYARESAKLDYKVTFDPTSNRDAIELAKDIVAMANTAGGYICIGVDDNGDPVGADKLVLDRCDETVIRAKVQAYLGRSLDLFVNAPVDLDGKHFGLVTVLKSAHSPIVFQKDGQYPNPTDPKKTKQVFSAGDVFVRHGSASERWNQNDVGTIYARVIERQKERWMREFVPDVKRLFNAAGLGTEPEDPREVLTRDASAFEKFARLLAKRFLS